MRILSCGDILPLGHRTLCQKAVAGVLYDRRRVSASGYGCMGYWCIKVELLVHWGIGAVLAIHK